MNFIKKLIAWFKGLNVSQLPSLEDIVGKLPMDFKIIEIIDDDAKIYTADANEVEKFLKSNSLWFDSLITFQKYNWSVGEWMEYPSGWIFCVADRESIHL